jgi:hypothetical protein
VSFPFESLPENLAAFCAVLRREHRFRIGPRELQDAARALELADLADERVVRDMLRPVLSGTLDEVRAFDPAFDGFFHGIRAGAPPRDALAVSTGQRSDAHVGRTAPGEPAARERPPAARDQADGTAEDVSVRGTPGRPEDTREPAAGLLRSAFGALEAEGAVPELVPPDRAWRGAASLLVSRVHRGLSRRWIAAARGPRFDLRRALRSSLHTGGDVVVPRWRARPRRRPRFVMLIDGSRSMAPYAATALATAVSLSAVTATVETWTFSTALRHVTRDVRRAAAGERRRLPLSHAWGGGTTIGACLREFLQRFGDRVLTRETVVIVASDGLDVGPPDLLREAMARVSRRSAAVLWLNPFAKTPGFEPTAAGMSAARPFITVLTSVGDAEGLRRLALGLRI